MSHKLRVLIADDHQQCQWAVTKLLSLTFDPVGAVADGRELVDAAITSRPDVIVSDVSMPRMTGNQAMVELRAKGYDIPFVLISSDWSGAEEYVRQGAMAFVAKIDMGKELRNAVVSAYSGQLYISRSVDTDAHAKLNDFVLAADSSNQSLAIQ
jgi:DNA-binding NarL/FixJ family response regulator